MTFVPSEVIIQSTGSLNKAVAEELKVPDPSPEKAEAIIKANEHTQGNDRE